MRNKKFMVLTASIIMMLVLVLMSCAPATTTSTPTATATKPAATVTQPPVTQVVEKDKAYNYLSPRGIALPTPIRALAARPASLDGLKVYICQGEADPIIMPAMAKLLPTMYPKTTWVYFEPTSGFGPAAVQDDVKANAKAVMRGISW